MTFKLWLPGRAPNHNMRRLFGHKCTICHDSGEEDHRYQKGIGYSYIPCKCTIEKEETIDSGTITGSVGL